MRLTTLLTHAISQISNTINTLHRQHNVLDENEANARHALLYINTCLPFYKENKSSLPNNEFDLLIETIMCLPHNSKILEEMVYLLIIVNDILQERTPSEKRFQTISSVIEKLPDSIFENIKIDRTSKTANYIKSKLNKPIELIDPAAVKKENVVVMLKGVEEYNGEENFEAVDKLLDSNALPSSEQISLLVKLIDDYALGKFQETELTTILHALYSNNKDKDEFTKNFLKAYQISYDGFYRKSNGKNVLLKGIAIIFPILDKHLTPGQLLEFLSEINFDLKDPQASENDNAYYYYFNIIKLFKGEKNTGELYDYNGRVLSQIIYEEYGRLHSIMQILSRDTLSGIELSKSPVLALLPPHIQSDISEQKRSVQVEFEKFITLFVQVNQNASKHQQRNISLFFFKHYDVIRQLLCIMGSESIYYMRNHLAGTVLNLERTLEFLPRLPEELLQPLAQYFNQCGVTTKKHPEQIDAFKTCIIALKTLINLQAHKEELETNFSSMSDYYLSIAKGKTPQEFLNALAKILLSFILQKNNIDLTDKVISEIFKRIKPTQFAQLAAASQHMAQDEYRDVYLNLLQLDLIGGNIDAFLHDTHQQNDLGQKLAHHNERIRTKLIAQSISPKTALHYDKNLCVIVQPANITSQVNKGNLIVVLWTYLTQLKKETDKLLAKAKMTDVKNTQRLAAIAAAIEMLQKSIKQNQLNPTFEIVNALTTGNAQALIEKIIRNIDALIAHNAETSSVFNEFAQHTKDQCEIIKQTKNQPTNKIDLSYFRVEQWSKEKFATFFLGDEVGCCLATTNSQFQAMVQRRMDDAMLFHVAIDQITGRPAALIWLYLAETADKDIVLIANFFEVNTKYAVNDSLRLALLNALLLFTQKYCEANPNIKGFYMNQLSYGWNIKDIRHYPLTELVIADKLGGPFIPDIDAEQIDMEDLDTCKQIQELTKQKYYLVSLNQNQFHKFDSAILASDIKPEMIDKDMLIQNAVFLIAKYETKLDKVMQLIIDKHRLELAPFYQASLERDANFINDVNFALQNSLDFESANDPTKEKNLSGKSNMDSLGFFSSPKFTKEENYLIAHRHDNEQAQHQYDKRFGLIIRKS